MLEIYTYSVLITAVFFTGFGIFIVFKSYSERIPQLFGLICLGFAIWAYSWFALLLTSASDVSTAVFYAKLLNSGAVLIPIFFLHWALEVLRSVERHKYFLIFGYIFTIVFSFLAFNDLFTAGVRPVGIFPHWPVQGPLFLVFILVAYVGFVLYASVWLLHAFYTKSGEVKYRAGYMLLGAVLGFGGSATIFPISYGLDTLEPYGVFLMMMSPFVFGYATLKYRLMNLKIFSTQFFIGVLNLVLLINLLLAKTVPAQFFGVLIFGFGVVFSVLLWRSVLREIESREEIQRLYKELEVKNQKLTELDKLKSQFLSIATHELRTPLTIVRNFISLMMDGTYGKVPPAAEEAGRQVFERVNDMARSVDTYLNVSRIEQGKISYSFAPGDLTHIIELAVEGLKANAEKKKLALTLTVKPGAEKVMANIDAPKITEVVINLIDNSIKYTPQGSIRVSLEKVGRRARVTIVDTGVGMTEKTKQNLFKLFSPGEDSKKINPASTGVGLYVSLAHVLAHKGTLTASSEGQGKGSTFILELPLS